MTQYPNFILSMPQSKPFSTHLKTEILNGIKSPFPLKEESDAASKNNVPD